MAEEVAPPSLARRLSSGRLHLSAGAVAPPSLAALAVAPPGWGGCTSWCNQGPNGSLHSAHFESFQGPNCPKIKLMGSPPISNLIIVLTTIFPKTFTATCSGASIASSGELPANFRRSSDEPSVMLLRTSGKLLDLRRSTWRVPTSFAWQASGLLGFVPAELPTTVRTSVELSNSQRDHSPNSSATPATCLTFIVVNPAHLSQHMD